jgi:hypothetical protein
MKRTGWSRTNPGCILSGLGFHAGVLLLLCAVWLAVGLPLGACRLRRAEQAWAQGFLSEEQYRARYPERVHSPSAERLDRLARQLGTNLIMTPEDLKDRSRPDTSELKPAWEWLGEVRKQHRDGPLCIPPALARLLERRAGELEAIEEELLGNEDLHWKTGRGGDLPVSLLGLRNVHSLLMVRAVAADQAGAAEARDRTLEASWRLGGSLWPRTEMVERLIAFVMAKDRNACLRRFRGARTEWVERLRDPRPMTSLADNFQAEARQYCRSARRLMGIGDIDYLPGADLPAISWKRWLVRVVSAPYLRLSVAGYSDGVRHEAERLRRLDPCRLEREPYEEAVKKAQPAWNILARVAASGLVAGWLAGRDAVLDDELTVAVLEARAAPVPARRSEAKRPSAICSTLTWVSTPLGPAETRIAAEGEPVADAPDQHPQLYYSVISR